MRAPHLTPPLVLHLPRDLVAEYVPGSDPPLYWCDALWCDLPVDVVIPDDLAAQGWYWHGGYLTDGSGISIGTATFPPPPFPTERYDCYTAARTILDERAKHQAMREARPVKQTKQQKTKQAEPAQLVHAMMEF